MFIIESPDEARGSYSFGIISKTTAQNIKNEIAAERSSDDEGDQ